MNKSERSLSEEPMRRCKPYQAYKDSGVKWLGVIPATWEVHRLKDVATIQMSNVDKKSVEGEEPVELCNYTDVYYHDRITSGMSFMQATAPREQMRRFALHAGDVLITKDSESWMDIAVPSVVVEDLPNVLCGYHLAHIRPRLGVYGPYLARAIGAVGPRDQFRVSANGVTRFAIGTGAITTALFAIPSITEQRAISDFLDRETARIDSLVAKKERLIELLQERRTALITRAVTKGLDPNAPMNDSGVEWLGKIPAHWELSKMWQISSARSGATPARDVREYWEGDVPWVSPKDMKRRVITSSEESVTSRAIDETGLRIHAAPCVLIVVRGMILAHSFPVAITSAPVTINQDMKALSLSSAMEPEYAVRLFEGIGKAILATILEEAAHGTKAVRMDVWRTVRVPVPPIIEQRAIVSFVDHHASRVDRLISHIRAVIDHLHELRTALISAAVTGKIDVREAVQ